jgi:DNA-binding NarL/FixJ family response regulator
MKEKSFRKKYELEVLGGNKLKAIIKTVPYCERNKIILYRHTIIEIQPNINLAMLSNNGFYDKYQITGREKEILLYILQGYRNKDISEKVFLSEAGVKKYVSNIYDKTNIKNRSELLKLITEKI